MKWIVKCVFPTLLLGFFIMATTLKVNAENIVTEIEIEVIDDTSDVGTSPSEPTKESVGKPTDEPIDEPVEKVNSNKTKKSTFLPQTNELDVQTMFSFIGALLILGMLILFHYVKKGRVEDE